MCDIIDLRKYRRARFGREQQHHRARLTNRATQNRPGLVSIGVVSAELMRRLTESD